MAVGNICTREVDTVDPANRFIRLQREARTCSRHAGSRRRRLPTDWIGHRSRPGGTGVGKRSRSAGNGGRRYHDHRHSNRDGADSD